MSRNLTPEEHDRRVLWSIVNQYKREGYSIKEIMFLTDKDNETVNRLLNCTKEEA